MYMPSGLSNERSHADIGVHDDSVMMRAAHRHTPGPVPALTDFSGHLGTFDGDGVDGGTHVSFEVSVGPIECLSGCPGEVPADDPSDEGIIVEVGQIEAMNPGDGQDANTSTDGNSTDAGTKENNNSQDHNSQDDSGDNHDNDGDHKDGSDNHDDTKGDDASKGDMPNPDGGPGNPNSTPNPDGDDDGSEGSHHGAPGGHSIGSGGGDGEGESPRHTSPSERLEGGGDNQQGSGGNGGSHGPLDPGEEMPNPEAGGGSPSSSGAHSFWDQAAAATQGVTSGEHLSTSGGVEHATASEVAFNTAAAGAAHDISGTQSDTSAHSLTGTYDVASAHADLHAELGKATLHDQLTLGGESFAHQMHV